MVVSAQPVAPSLGTTLAIGCFSRLQQVDLERPATTEATTPSFVKSSIWTMASCQ